MEDKSLKLNKFRILNLWNVSFSPLPPNHSCFSDKMMQRLKKLSFYFLPQKICYLFFVVVVSHYWDGWVRVQCELQKASLKLLISGQHDFWKSGKHKHYRWAGYILSLVKQIKLKCATGTSDIMDLCRKKLKVILWKVS